MIIKKILNWTDPTLSGIVFASGFAFLVSLRFFSLLSIVSYIALTLFFVCLGSKVYVHLMGALKKPCKDPLEKLEKIDASISSESVEKVFSFLVQYFNLMTLQLKSLCLLQNYFDSTRFAVLLYVLTCIGGIFNTLTLITSAWIVLFIFPTVYEQNQKTLDDLFVKVKAQYDAINERIAATLNVPAKVTSTNTEKKE